MPPWPWLILFTAIGACVGSFLNVVIYRVPAGESLLSPGSRCPHCGRALSWFDNVPVLAWFYLLGRCRTCRAAISIQYPMIEAVTATLFGGLFAIFYMTDLRPDFAESGLGATWGVYGVYLILVAGLLGSTLIDAKYFIIPLSIPRVVTMVAIAGLPLAAMVMPVGGDLVSGVGDWEVGAAAGGGAGLVVANVLLAIGLIPRSFVDDVPAEDEAGADDIGPADESAGVGNEAAVGNETDATARVETAEPIDAASTSNDESPDEAEVTVDHRAATNGQAGESVDEEGGETWDPWQGFGRELMFTGCLLVLGVVVYIAARPFMSVEPAFVPLAGNEPIFAWPLVLGVMVGVCVLAMLAALIWSVTRPTEPADADAPPPDAPEPPDPSDVHAWLSHANPRGEVARECLFLIWPVAGAIAGVWLMRGGQVDSQPVRVLATCVCGYLGGAGLVWLTRVIFTLLLNKEAMGLGDVHLLGAIGAVLGWLDSVMVFFIAPFFGLLAVGAMATLGPLFKGKMRVIPYGPYLAAAAVVVMIFDGRSLLELLVNSQR